MESIPIASITPSPYNPRQSFPEEALEELAASIRKVGILQPIVVRPIKGRFIIEPGSQSSVEGWFLLDRILMMPGRDYAGVPKFFETEQEALAALPRYEIVAGERRWRAASLADLREVPAIVKDLSDTDAAELAIVENLQRSDISAFEEAMGFRRLIDLGAHTADSLAGKLGKSRSHVFGRLRLCKLCPAVTEALNEGKIEASTAELLAKFDTEALQTEALQEILDQVAGWAEEDEFPVSFRRAKKALKEFYPDLGDAPWVMHETKLAGGECAKCPKRSGNMPDTPPGVRGPNICTDRHCYRARMQEVRKVMFEDLRHQGRAAVDTLEENDKAFTLDYWGNGRFYSNSPWIAEDQTCWEAKKDGASWHSVLSGLGAKWEALVTPDGKEIQVMDKGEAESLALQHERIERVKGMQRPSQKDRAQLIEDNRKQKFLAEGLASALINKAASSTPDQVLTAAICNLRSHEATKYLSARFGVDVREDAALLIDQLRYLGIGQLAGILVAASITAGEDLWCSWQMERWARLLGVNPDKVRQEAELEYEKESATKPKTAKAKKAASRKGTTTKVGQEARERIAAAAKARWAKYAAAKKQEAEA